MAGLYQLESFRAYPGKGFFMGKNYTFIKGFKADQGDQAIARNSFISQSKINGCQI